MVSLNFDPRLCRNESEVISKLIVSYLLPQLGYSPDSWHQEVKVADIRLDFLTLVTPVIPFILDQIRPPNIVIEAKHPGQKLDRHNRKLRRYLSKLNARYGLLTNGKELKIYERDADGEVRLKFACQGKEIPAKINDIRAILGKISLSDIQQTVSSETERISNSPPCDLQNRTTAQTVNVSGEAERISNSLPCDLQNRTTMEEKSNMKVIAIYHNKGGVGKTTVSVNLAASLSRKGKKVLLIDMDAQANTTFATGLIKFQFEEDDNIIQSYVFHLLESGDFNFIPDIVRRSQGFNTPEIDVIPSHINLIEHQDKLNKIAVSRSRLLVKLKQVRDYYDIVIIDTPPSRDLYAEIPLIAADYLIIPSDLKPFANQGLNNVKNFVKQVNEYREAIARDPLVLMGVLPSKISTNSQFLKHTFPRQKSVISDRHNLPLMESIIYERTPLSNCLSRTKNEGEIEIPDPKSIFDFCDLKSDTSAEQSAEDFEFLAAEVLNKIQ
ncbi:MAG: chromosome partitioning protein ParA [Desulfobacteraceae bacterium IS3]|nr:MAG: chromosome partitioning protein ParA [Desulfobacteraceae bacterium IS3]